ncbi:hypothetical protein [Staphylococcus nepalensis]|uniref:hypothetical protein n=1 Tax=Staphylococcus nepalensis TaxID=214473 RepID=UPI00383B3081
MISEEQQVIISQAGLERDEKQLADYLPSLYELLAVSTDEKIHNKLMKRLGKATWQVNQSLDKKNPYKNILNLLLILCLINLQLKKWKKSKKKILTLKICLIQ